MDSDPKIPPFVNAFSGAFLTAPRNPLALLFAFVSICFGTEAFHFFSEGVLLGNHFQTISDLFSKHPLVTLLVLPAYLVSVFSRTALLFSLIGTRPRLQNIFRKTLRILPSILLLETGFFLILLISAIALLSPSILSGETFPSEILRLSGTFLFLMIGIVLLFTETYAVLYLAFSDIPLRDAINLGYELLRKHGVDSSFFGLFSLFLGFATSLLIAGILFLSSFSLFQQTTSALGVLIVLTLYVAIRKKAWIIFFLTITRPKKKEGVRETSQNKEKVIQREVPETGKASTARTRP